MATSNDQGEGKYFIDAESTAETARLMYQDRLTTEQMSGVLHEHSLEKISTLRSVLDLACGPGGWVVDLAYASPNAQIVGVDISKNNISYAQSQARAQGLDNARFQVMDILKPLDFPDNSFDLINARLLFSFMPKHAWVPLAQECQRILRPGGILRMTEMSDGSTNSLACNQLNAQVTKALFLTGRSFSPDGQTTGIAPMLGRFLLDANYVSLSKAAYAVDASAGMDAHWQFYQNYKVLYRLLKPFLLQMKVTTSEEFESLYEQALEDIESDTFCAMNFILTVWGEKPGQE
jgi:ubiquinone/menaquinone biosynthesis C-methylase UbiE